MFSVIIDSRNLALECAAETYIKQTMFSKECELKISKQINLLHTYVLIINKRHAHILKFNIHFTHMCIII